MTPARCLCRWHVCATHGAADGTLGAHERRAAVGLCQVHPGIHLSYNDGDGKLHEVRFDVFQSGVDRPRAYVENSVLTFSVSGAALQSGYTRAHRYIWAVDALATTDQAYDLEDMFKAWDLDRAKGEAAVIAITDEIMVRDVSDPIVTNCVFTTSPKLGVGSGTGLLNLSFGLTEV